MDNAQSTSLSSIFLDQEAANQQQNKTGLMEYVDFILSKSKNIQNSPIKSNNKLPDDKTGNQKEAVSNMNRFRRTSLDIYNIQGFQSKTQTNIPYPESSIDQSKVNSLDQTSKNLPILPSLESLNNLQSQRSSSPQLSYTNYTQRYMQTSFATLQYANKLSNQPLIKLQKMDDKIQENEQEKEKEQNDMKQKEIQIEKEKELQIEKEKFKEQEKEKQQEKLKQQEKEKYERDLLKQKIEEENQKTEIKKVIESEQIDKKNTFKRPEYKKLYSITSDFTVLLQTMSEMKNQQEMFKQQEEESKIQEEQANVVTQQQQKEQQKQIPQNQVSPKQISQQISQNLTSHESVQQQIQSDQQELTKDIKNEQSLEAQKIVQQSQPKEQLKDQSNEQQKQLPKEEQQKVQQKEQSRVQPRYYSRVLYKEQTKQLKEQPKEQPKIQPDEMQKQQTKQTQDNPKNEFQEQSKEKTQQTIEQPKELQKELPKEQLKEYPQVLSKELPIQKTFQVILTEDQLQERKESKQATVPLLQDKTKEILIQANQYDSKKVKNEDQEMGKDLPKVVEQNTINEIPKVLPKEYVREIPKLYSYQFTLDKRQELPKEISKHTLDNQLPKEVVTIQPQGLPNQISKEPAKESIQEVPKPVRQEPVVKVQTRQYGQQPINEKKTQKEAFQQPQSNLIPLIPLLKDQYKQISVRIEDNNLIQQIFKDNNINDNARRPEERYKGYLILKQLGGGQFSSVYLAKHIETNFLVALKVIKKSRIIEEGMNDQFTWEIKIQYLLKHPNIDRLYTFFKTDTEIILVLEYSPGGTATQELKRVGKIPESKVRQLVKQTTQAIAFLHANEVIHRDLKPDNILLTFDQVKLGDFSFCIYSPSLYRQTQCGTMFYSSPEIMCGEMYDNKTDLWGLGVLTYELCFGMPPWSDANKEAESILEAQLKIPQQASNSLVNFLNCLIQKLPRDRLNARQALSHPWIKEDPEQNKINYVAGFEYLFN